MTTTTMTMAPTRKLGDSFYDLTGWRKMHPAGEHWIDRFAVRDEAEKRERATTVCFGVDGHEGKVRGYVARGVSSPL